MKRCILLLLLEACLTFSNVFEAFGACGCNSEECAPPVPKQCQSACSNCSIPTAKKEGKVVWYVSNELPIEQQKALTDLFRKQFSFVTVERYSAGGNDIISRVLSESGAGRATADLVSLPVTQIGDFKENKLIERLGKGLKNEVIPGTFSSDFFWYSLFVDFYVFAHNTRLIKNPPKSYQDIIKHGFAGSVAVQADTAWLLGLENALGKGNADAFIKDLAKQKSLTITENKMINAQRVAAGEFELALTYARIAAGFKDKGMPIDWYPIEPVVGNLYVTGMFSKAPHRAAASLFLNFLFSPVGQAEIAKSLRTATRTDVKGPPEMRKLGEKKTAFVPEAGTRDMTEASKAMKALLYSASR